eukprot:10779893-Alexandrium_andersonii.AAC.1
MPPMRRRPSEWFGSRAHSALSCAGAEATAWCRTAGAGRAHGGHSGERADHLGQGRCQPGPN